MRHRKWTISFFGLLLGFALTSAPIHLSLADGVLQPELEVSDLIHETLTRSASQVLDTLLDELPSSGLTPEEESIAWSESIEDQINQDADEEDRPTDENADDEDSDPEAALKRSKRSVGGHVPPLSPLYPVPYLQHATDPTYGFPWSVVHKTQEMTERLSILREKAHFQMELLRKIGQVLDHAVRPHGANNLFTGQTLKHVRVLKATMLSNLGHLQRVLWSQTPLTLGDWQQFQSSSIRRVIGELKNQLATIKSLISDVVMRDEPAEITAPKKFTGPVRMNSLSGSELHINSIGREEVTHTLNQLFRPSQSRGQEIRGHKRIVSDLVVNGTISAVDVNGFNLRNDVMRSNVPQTIETPLIFQRGVGGHRLDTSHINGISTDELVFLNETAVITSPKRFLDVVDIGHLQARQVDGVDLGRLLRGTLTKSGDQVIRNLHFHRGSRLAAHSIDRLVTLNGIHFDRVLGDLVFIDQPTNITGHKTFILDEFRCSELTVGSLNGIRLPGDLITAQRRVTGSKNFTGQVIFAGPLKVSGRIDGVRYPADVVTLTGSETINSSLSFRSPVVVNGPVSARRVDGVDLPSLKRDALTLSGRYLSNSHFMGPVTVQKDLNVRGHIDGVDLNGLMRDTVLKSDSPAIIHSAKTFRAPVRAASILMNGLNGHSFQEVISTKNSEVISAPLSFMGPVKIAGNIRTGDGLVSGVNLTDLFLHHISLRSPSRISALLHFQHLTVSKDLNLTGTINGLRPERDLVWKSHRVSEILAPKKFNNILIESPVIVRKDVRVRGLVNGVDLRRLDAERVSLSGNQNLTSPLPVAFSGVRSLHTQFLNGQHADSLLSDIVLNNSPHVQIRGRKNFIGPVTFGSDVHPLAGVNGGRSINQINQKAIKLNSETLFRHPVTFVDPLLVRGSVTLRSNILNGFNLHEMLSDSIWTHRPENVTFAMPIHFARGLRVEGNIHTGRVNGMHLGRDILLKRGRQVITGPVTFAGGLHVHNSTNTQALINGIDVAQLSRQTINVNRPNSIRGLFVVDGLLESLNSVNVSRNINGIGNLSALAADTVLQLGDGHISAPKMLTAPLRLMKGIYVTKINGHRVSDILRGMVFTNSPTNLSGPLHFTGPVVINNGNLRIGRGSLNLTGRLNGVDVRELMASAVLTDRPAVFKVPVEFVHPVNLPNETHVYGPINGVRNLTEDLITLHSPQVISGRKKLTNVLSLGNVAVTGAVNGLHLPMLLKSTLRNDTKQGNVSFRAPVRINGPLTVEGDIQVQTLNGFNPAADLVSLHGDEALHGNFRFSHPTQIRGPLQVKGLINGVDMGRLLADSLLRDIPQVIDQPLHISSVIFDKPVESAINGLDLRSLTRAVDQFAHSIDGERSRLETSLARVEKGASYLLEIFEHGCNHIDGLSLYQVIDGVFADSIERMGDFMFRLSHSRDQMASVMRYDRVERHFTFMGTSSGANIQELARFSFNGSLWRVLSAPAAAHAKALRPLYAEIWIQTPSLKIPLARNVLHVAVQVSPWTGEVFIGVLQAGGLVQITRLGVSDSDQRVQLTPIGSVHPGSLAFKINLLLTSRGELFLTVLRDFGSHCVMGEMPTLIFRHNSPLISSNWTLVDQLAEPLDPVDILSFHQSPHPSHSTYESYLAVADRRSGSIWIYHRMEDNRPPPGNMSYVLPSSRESVCQFRLANTIPMSGVTRLKSFKMAVSGERHASRQWEAPDQYLLASNSTHVVLWQQLGASGFTRSWPLKVSHPADFLPFNLDGHLYLMVAQDKARCAGTLVYQANLKGLSWSRASITMD